MCVGGQLACSSYALVDQYNWLRFMVAVQNICLCDTKPFLLWLKVVSNNSVVHCRLIKAFSVSIGVICMSDARQNLCWE